MLINKIGLSQLTRLFLRGACPLCERPAANLLCTTCTRQLVSDHSTLETTPLTVFAWGQYRGLLKQALALLKYGNQAELGVWLGVQLGNAWHQQSTDHPWHTALVIPIPLHRERQQQRGYNQAALIAQGFCRATGLTWAPHGLIRQKNTRAMYRLGILEREANLTNAFQLGRGLPPKSQTILLVDDIYTTGTTARSAAKVLTQAGYTVIGMISVARAVAHTPNQTQSTPARFDQTLN